MDRTPPIISWIPGYKGYRDKENRRDTDKRVRELVAERLGQAAGRVELVAADLANRREIMAVGSVDAGAKSIRHLQDQIATATYGYGGLWSDRPVDAAALDQIVQFDSDLLTRIESLNGPIGAIESAQDLTFRETALVELRTAVTGIQTRFDERKRVVETGLPSAPSTDTAPLTGGPTESTKPLPSIARTLEIGDQVIVRGQQVVVSAIIQVTGDLPLSLYRVGSSPARWLVVTNGLAADTTAAEITPIGTGASANGEGLALTGAGAGTATMTGFGSLPDQQAVTYQLFSGSGGSQTVGLLLSWAATGLSLVGQLVPDDALDIPERTA